MFNNELWQKPAGGAGGGDFYSHQIASSLRNSAAQDGTLQWTAGTPTSSTTMTMSYWVKRYTTSTDGGANNIFVTGTGGGSYIIVGFSSNAWQFQPYGGSWGTGGGITMNTSALYRDTSAWYHHVIRIDTTESTQADRVRLYVNGERITSFSTEGVTGNLSASESVDYINQSGVVQAFGGLSGKGHGTEGADLQMAEIIFNDGQSYGPDSYGETKNGVWIPKNPSGLTFGNNGYWLKMASGAIGTDSSGNGNNFTVANIAAHDVMLDSPTFNSDSNGGNFATLNALTLGSYGTLSEGNLRANGNSSDGSYMASTMAFKTGKWYMEFLCVARTEGWPYISILDYANTAFSTTTGMQGWAIRYQADADLEVNTGDSISNFGTITLVATGLTTYTNGDIIGIYLDCDNKKVWFAKNGSFFNSGDPSAGTNPQATWTGTPTIAFMGATYNNNDYIMNFGQDGTFAGEKTAQGNSDDTGYGNFYYAPDTGFLAMCAGNLPVADAVNPALTDDNFPQKLFNPLIYTGDNGGSFTTGFQPDLVWVKRRDGDQSNGLWDSSRGTTKILISNEQDAEGTSSGLTSFDSTGYTMGTYYNQTGNTYVSWSWRANGGSSSNSDGATSSTVQAAPGGGFSIVTYTGFAGASGTSTVGHGMGVAPTMIIHKSRTRGSGWWTQVPGLLTDAGYFLNMESDSAQTNLNSYGTMNAPSTSVFTINGVDGVGGESADYVAYCFANIEGYCKVGSYVGNANDDGTFLYTGFRPAFFMCKPLVTGNWRIQDDKRTPFNVADKTLFPNRSDAELSNDSNDIDIVSNGVKMRASDSDYNQATTFIYLALAENPFKFATAR